MMWLVRIALEWPYTFVVMAMLIAILGISSILLMPTDIFPSINIPVVSIIWTYTGMSPDDMQGAYYEFDSPINPLIADAYGKGPKDQVGDLIPFTSQGPHAPGGAKNYIVDGKMTAGFAFVAYPAEYRSSGVMTFIVNESGTIYEKDLGANTTKLAEMMTAYDPDSTWYQAE
jgi:hypothetical protein